MDFERSEQRHSGIEEPQSSTMHQFLLVEWTEGWMSLSVVKIGRVERMPAREMPCSLEGFKGT